MIASQEIDIVGISYLQSKQVHDNFRTILSSVNIIAHEQDFRILFARLAEFAKHCNKIEELTMDVANNDDFAFKSHKIWLVT